MNKRIVIGRLNDSRYTLASLAEINEGDWVEYDDGQYGAVTGKVDGPIEWPTGDDETKKIEDQGDGKQIYVVARVSGGSKPFTEDELTVVDRDTAIGDDEEMPDNPEEDIDDAELAASYHMIAQSDVAELHRQTVSELISVPGVEDPGVGFDSWPDSWEKSDKPARLIALDAWTSLGGTFTGCMSEIGSRRICAAFKDEMLGTERWRNRF